MRSTGVAERPVDLPSGASLSSTTLRAFARMCRDLTFCAHACRWDAAQRLARGLLLSLYNAAMAAGGSSDLQSTLTAAGGVSQRLIDAYRSILTTRDIDGSLATMTLALPSQSELVQSIPEADPVVVHGVRGYVRRTIAQQLMPELLQARHPSTRRVAYRPACHHACQSKFLPQVPSPYVMCTLTALSCAENPVLVPNWCHSSLLGSCGSV